MTRDEMIALVRQVSTEEESFFFHDGMELDWPVLARFAAAIIERMAGVADKRLDIWDAGSQRHEVLAIAAAIRAEAEGLK